MRSAVVALQCEGGSGSRSGARQCERGFARGIGFNTQQYGETGQFHMQRLAICEGKPATNCTCAMPKGFEEPLTTVAGVGAPRMRCTSAE